MSWLTACRRAWVGRLPMRVLVCALLLPAGTTVRAELLATPLRGDTRLVQFPYDADNTYLVLARPRTVTHLQFGADETIRSVAAGDTQNWSLEPTKDRRHLFVKAVHEDQETSLTVLTDQRTYQFVLRSTGEGRKWYQRVSWAYPERLVLDLEGPVAAVPPDSTPAAGAPSVGPGAGLGGGAAANRLATRPASTPAPPAPGPVAAEGEGDPPSLVVRPESLRFGYEITGDAPFRPTAVFDDGRFTYLQLARTVRDLPALLVAVDGEYALVNYELRQLHLVVQRVFDKAVLKLGRSEVHVRRVADEARGGGRRDAPATGWGPDQ